MKPTLTQVCCVVVLVLIAACTVIIGNDNAPTQTDNNDTDVMTGLRD